MKKLSVLVSTGNLGDNIIEKSSFYQGLKHDIDYLAADAGTADAGPTFLGADMPHNPIKWEEHDIELLLVESRRRNIPMIIGSCSTTGTDRAVDLYAEEEALFSLPFSLAIALREGDVGLHHFSPANLRDESLIKLAKKVHISLDKEMDSNYPLHRGAILQIILNDGKSFEKQTQLPKGEPELPLTDDELYGKVNRVTSPFYQDVFSKRLWQIVVNSNIDQVQYAEIIELFKEGTNENESFD
ncbi:MAG TPA: hypothetical protein ENN27_01030 [Candidatus Atribacteria bacterium]|nr:hypothetical protein [Candidatus Atribacteria bacterium]